MGITLIIFVLVVLVLLSALSSSIETAFSSLNIIRIKQYSKSSKKKISRSAKRILKINKEYPMFISTILVFNNTVNVIAASVTTFLFTQILMQGEKGVLWASLIISVIIIVFGEIIPKTFARVVPEKLAMFTSRFVIISMFALKPITIWFGKLDSKISDKYDSDHITATENELLEIVEMIEKEGVLEHTESELIQSAITFDEKSVRITMTPKEEVLTIDINTSFEQLSKIFKEEQFSRIPVYDKEKDKIIGIVYQRDVFDYLCNREEVSVKNLMLPPIFISHRRLLPFALESIQRHKSHLAVVVDNLKDKNFLGIITLEDIIEELVGEIYDEHDEHPGLIFEIGNHLFHVKGKVLLEDFFDNYIDEVEFPKTKAKTMSGWIKEIAGVVNKNDVIYYENIKITVLDKEGANISLVEVEELTNYSEE